MAKRKKTKIKLKPILLLSIIIILIIVLVFMNNNKLNLIGLKTATINMGEEYIEEGINYQKKEVTKKVKVNSKVNNKLPGVYKIEYTYKFKNKVYKITRKIIVKDMIIPTISLKDGSEIMFLKGSTYKDPGYLAIDNLDGDLTKSVKVSGSVDTSVLGEYTITYKVTDKAKNTAIKKRKIIVSDKSPLTMNLKEFDLSPWYQDSQLKEKVSTKDYLDSIAYMGDSMVLYYDINKILTQKQLWYNNGIDPKTAQTKTVFHYYKDTNKTFLEVYKEEKPEITVITLGTNSVAFMLKDDFINYYEKLILGIKKESPKTKIIVQSIPPVDKRWDEKANSASTINNDKINKFNYYLLVMCNKLDIKFLNSAKEMKDEYGQCKVGYCIDKDGIHPTKIGHNKLYDYLKNHAY